LIEVNEYRGKLVEFYKIKSRKYKNPNLDILPYVFKIDNVQKIEIDHWKAIPLILIPTFQLIEKSLEESGKTLTIDILFNLLNPIFGISKTKLKEFFKIAKSLFKIELVEIPNDTVVLVDLEEIPKIIDKLRSFFNSKELELLDELYRFYFKWIEKRKPEYKATIDNLYHRFLKGLVFEVINVCEEKVFQQTSVKYVVFIHNLYNFYIFAFFYRGKILKYMTYNIVANIHKPCSFFFYDEPTRSILYDYFKNQLINYFLRETFTNT